MSLILSRSGGVLRFVHALGGLVLCSGSGGLGMILTSGSSLLGLGLSDTSGLLDGVRGGFCTGKSVRMIR